MAGDDEAPVVTSVAAVDHRHLRPAIEFAVSFAATGQRLRPPVVFPAALKPFLRQPRVPAGALGKLRRAIDGDQAFRKLLAVAAVPELVDAIGIEWLQRHDGWEERLLKLVDEAERSARELGADAARRSAEKRRDAAEQAAVRTRAELLAAQQRIGEQATQLEELRASLATMRDELEAAKVAAATARLAARHADDRAGSAQGRLAAAEAARIAAEGRAAAAEEQRDVVLASRAELAALPSPASNVAELRDLARSVRSAADRLSALVDVAPARRQPLALPGGTSRHSGRATEFLLRAPNALILVDGYNVAKQAWPDDTLEIQRERLLDALEDLARRLGSAVTVVFDGASVVGAHSNRRRLVRVEFSPGGVSADDVIRADVAATPPARPVVVVTNDRAIQRDVAAAGANLVTTDAFLSFCT